MIISIDNRFNTQKLEEEEAFCATYSIIGGVTIFILHCNYYSLKDGATSFKKNHSYFICFWILACRLGTEGRSPDDGLKILNVNIGSPYYSHISKSN